MEVILLFTNFNKKFNLFKKLKKIYIFNLFFKKLLY